METTVGRSRIVLARGDITREATDAIVNAANTTLLGGGGVDGAIHRAGGPEILAECKAIAERQGGCPTGEAVITNGGKLPARYVIHTVGPVWSGGKRREPELLASAYRQSLRLAAKHGVASLAFPSISTGAYRFPIALAAKIALGTVKDFLEHEEHSLKEVRFVLFSDEDLAVYQSAWAQLAQS
jgi:O-acetyl-ADP-ribose deacetylase (regulator of RNase III)